MNIPGGRTQVLNDCRIKKIDYHPAKSDEDGAPESIFITKDNLNWNDD
jgi:hypothetical protein